MAIKMRVLCASGKKKIHNVANMIKLQYDLGVNAVDVIPPAYSCDKERIVILIVSGKGGNISDKLRLFCRELTKARAQNVALIMDGDKSTANALREIIGEAGNRVYDEVLYIKGGFPIFGASVKPDEKKTILEWVDRVINNLQ